MKIFIFPFIFGFLPSCTPLSFMSNPSSSVKDEHYKRNYHRGSYYVVKEGDTLHYIAYLTNKDINDIILANRLSNPNKIYPGQKLNLWRKKYLSPVYGEKQFAKFDNHQPSSKGNTSAPTYPAKINQKGEKTQNKSSYVADKAAKTANKSNYCADASRQELQHCSTELTWQWPTKGRVISDFSSADLGNKGIDIAGRRGQYIASSANGKVVYAGSALRGYGNLIIIKHNENYLSAYAHNDSLLVSENQRVRKGQRIATMGSSGTNSVRLHFEIRYKGKSVNPNRYLPSI